MSSRRKIHRPYRQERQRAERLGRWAEYFTLAILFFKGYRILEHRWQSKAGEIDIVAVHQGTLIFIEVKARDDADDAKLAVTPANRRMIERAANSYVSYRRIMPIPPFRFDIVTITGLHWVHLRSAWREGD